MESYRPLTCKDGCCKDKLTQLFEQHFTDQDRVLVELQDDYITLLEFIGEQLMPYLEVYARAGDEAAHELLLNLGEYL